MALSDADVQKQVRSLNSSNKFNPERIFHIRKNVDKKSKTNWKRGDTA